MGRGEGQPSGLLQQTMCPGRRSGMDGFTLVELMIVVVIVAILAAFAIPMYSAYVLRANRSAAESVMLDIASAQERFMIDNRSYASTLAQLGYTVPNTVSTFYTVTVTPVTGPPPGYTLTAAPVAGTTQARDTTCGTLTYASSGTKSPGGSTGCWK